MSNLIALSGHAGAGKSYVARRFVDLGGYQVVKFADALKAGLSAMLIHAGIPKSLTPRFIEGDLKETPLDILCGRSPRHAMQTLGTDWGRNAMHPDFWVNLTKYRVDGLLAQGMNVVIDDVRFDNEAEAVHSLGGVVVQVLRADLHRLTSASHASERGISRGNIDYTLHNSMPDTELDRWVCEMMGEPRDQDEP